MGSALVARSRTDGYARELPALEIPPTGAVPEEETELLAVVDGNNEEEMAFLLAVLLLLLVATEAVISVVEEG